MLLSLLLLASAIVAIEFSFQQLDTNHVLFGATKITPKAGEVAVGVRNPAIALRRRDTDKYTQLPYCVFLPPYSSFALSSFSSDPAFCDVVVPSQLPSPCRLSTVIYKPRYSRPRSRKGKATDDISNTRLSHFRFRRLCRFGRYSFALARLARAWVFALPFRLPRLFPGALLDINGPQRVF